MKMKRYLDRSIKAHTLLYFMLLSLVLITLLWTVQEWFFSMQFLRLKQNEIIRTVENRINQFNPSVDDRKEFCEELHEITIKNNLLIYYFSFDKSVKIITPDETILDEHSRPVRGVDGVFDNQVVLSAFIPPENIYQSIQWEAGGIQQNRFVYLLGLNNGQLSGQRTTASYEYNRNRNKLYYASECPSNDEEARYFIYMEAVISNEEITINLFRFEFALITLLCVLLTLMFSLLLSQIMATPITRMSKRAGLLAKGDFSVRFEGSGITELNRLAATLNYAAEEFEKAEQIRRDFIANISHDFRTPLTLVKGYAEMIRDISSNKPEKSREHTQIILDEAERLNYLVEDILKLSRLQSGVEVLNLSDFDLDEFCRSVIRRFKDFCEKRGFSIEYEGRPRTIVKADSDKISQVLYNLIGNALNYTDKETKTVWIRIYTERAFAVCEVRDNGKGIAPEEIEAVWDRYYRSNQQKRNVVGSGLGLSIVKNILLAHNTEYGVSSIINEGTTFWFKLPL